MAERKSLNRTRFLNEVAERTGAHRRDVEHVWENALSVLRDAVKSGTAVSISGFGKFGQRVTKAQPAGPRRNPFTGEVQKMPARPERRVPRFTPAKQFKEYVSGTVRTWPATATRPMALAAQTDAPAGRGGSRNGGRAGATGGAAKSTAKSAAKSTAKSTAKGGARKAAAKPAAKSGGRKTAAKSAAKPAAKGGGRKTAAKPAAKSGGRKTAGKKTARR